MSSPILSIRNATISFAKKVLFENLDLNLFPRNRICLIGKNGVGKTTLMKAICGDADFDIGERWIQSGCTVGYLSQSEKITKGLTAREYLMKSFDGDEQKSYLADIVCHNLQIDQDAFLEDLSGGQVRRVHLANALILEPDILLLDEPTNHLDLTIIQWLENYLRGYSGSLLVISHDRRFLANISNKVYWLRNGVIKVNNAGYGKFEEWSNLILDQEEREVKNLEKKVALESSWLQTGVTARRKRNVGRLHYLKELRQKLKDKRKLVLGAKSSIKINDSDLKEDSPHLISTFTNVSKSFGDKTIIDKFSIKILRGEKIGIIGKNGSGKSTLIKMLLGELKPDSGKIKPAKDLAISYFDQQRIGIKPNLTIQNILCPSGGDYINLANGKVRHICGYLKDFLFDPKDAKTRASTLSGGQQNRLLLAKTLANAGNFLILDEPTNDLDMDSLDMLQNFLSEYEGNLMIVSHDRDFLDNTVSSILAFEDDGSITHHLGGFSDYEEFKNKQKEPKIKEVKKDKKEVVAEIKPKEKSQKLSYKFVFELKKLPEKIEKMEKEISILSLELSDTEERSSANLSFITMKIADLQKKLDEAESRWIELEEMDS
ncbi:MAG: ATP-binding cassette subfamily F protein uup [Lentimonas sp.]|jgi:ATP-binding cassette subfamily F protein uup